MALLRSASSLNDPQRTSAAGTGLFLIQLPLAYLKKSRQGSTDLSTLSRLIPVPFRTGGGGGGGGGVAATAGAAAGVVDFALGRVVCFEEEQAANTSRPAIA